MALSLRRGFGPPVRSAVRSQMSLGIGRVSVSLARAVVPTRTRISCSGPLVGHPCLGAARTIAAILSVMIEPQLACFNLGLRKT